MIKKAKNGAVLHQKTGDPHTDQTMGMMPPQMAKAMRQGDLPPELQVAYGVKNHKKVKAIQSTGQAIGFATKPGIGFIGGN